MGQEGNGLTSHNFKMKWNLKLREVDFMTFCK